MKALILAGGYATRLWPLTKDKAKPLLLVNGKPIITHVVEKIPQDMEVYVATNSAFRKDFQKWNKTVNRPLNLIFEKTTNNANKLGALGAIANFIKEYGVTDDLLIIGGDNYFKFEIEDFLGAYNGNTLIAAYDLGDLEQAKRFGVLSVKGNKVVEFEEKPSSPKSTLINTFCCVFPSTIYPLLFDLIKTTSDNQGSFIEYLIKKTEVEAFITSDDWFDIGSFQGYMSAHQKIDRDRNHHSIAKFYGVDFCGSKNVLKGNVFIDEGSVIKNSTIENCIIMANCTIEDSSIKNCIIDEQTTVSNCKLSEQMIEKKSFLHNLLMDKEVKKHLNKDLAKDSGLPIKIKGYDLYLKDKKLKYAVRTLKELKGYLLKPRRDISLSELYRMYRDVAISTDREKLKKHGLRYDITIIAPGIIGEEFVKTIGHYHPTKEGKNLTFPEIYEVIDGSANYILQRPTTNGYEVLVVEAKSGDKVIIPPGYGHVTVNTGNKALVMANVVADNFSSQYEDYKNFRGAAVYRMASGFKPNPKYGKIDHYQKVKPNTCFDLYDLNLPLYTSATKQPSNYDYLVNPENYDFSDCFEKIADIKIS
jgi:glucose-1-phosphate thymidylyltransferase